MKKRRLLSLGLLCGIVLPLSTQAYEDGIYTGVDGNGNEVKTVIFGGNDTFSGVQLTIKMTDQTGKYHRGFNKDTTQSYSFPYNASGCTGTYLSGDGKLAGCTNGVNDARGGSGDTDENGFNPNPTNFTERQGPCDSGYHVPSRGERTALAIAWCNLDENCDPNTDITSEGAIYAGSKPLGTLFREEFDISQYFTFWSSSPKSDSDWNSWYLNFDDRGVYPHHYNLRLTEYRVRCLRNSIVAPTVNCPEGEEYVESKGKCIPSRAIIRDSVSGEIIQINDMEWDDLELYFLSGDGTTNHYTIMDRNLGASTVYNQNWSGQNTDSFGYVYQWGNNYGFTSTAASTLAETSINTISNTIWGKYIPSQYGRNTWSASSNWMAGSSTTDGIWGGTGDTMDRNGEGTTKEGRQGPCPEGYYIPSTLDWKTMYNAWYNSKSSTGNIGQQLASDWLMPAAGRRNYDRYVMLVGSFGYYKSSSPDEISNHYDYARGLTLTSANVFQANSYRSNGESVRCLKNSPTSTFTFTLHANGGNKAVVAFTGTVGDGKFTTLGTPTRSDSTFSGWYTANEGGEKLGVGSGVVPNIYARWSCPEGQIDNGSACVDVPKNNTVTFDYSTNGGSATTSGSVEVISGDILDLSLYTGTKAGWDFVGWNTDSGATAPISENYEAYPVTENITLYAIFKKEGTTLTGTIIPNGATVIVTPTEITCNIPTIYNNQSEVTSCPIDFPTATRENGTVYGYSTTNSETTTPEISNGATNHGISASTTFYVISKEVLTGTFYRNGNTSQTPYVGSASTAESVTATCDLWNDETSCNITTPTFVPASGKTAKGYTTAADVSNQDNPTYTSAGTSIALTASAQYYAQSKSDDIVLNVTYLSGVGVQSIGKNTDSCTLTGLWNDNQQATSCTVVAPEITLKAGYGTGKWSTGSISVNTGADITLTADDTYTASATPNTYTVSYNANGGIGSIASSGYTYDLSGNLAENTFTKTGYVFSGWMYNDEIYTGNQEIKNLTGINGVTITMVTQWAPIKYSVEFTGTDVSGTMANQEFTYDIPQKLTGNAFTKTGYIFSGWTYGTTGYVDEQNVSNLTTTDGATVTLTAQWTPIIYTISFSGNAADATGTAPATINAEYDSGDIAPDNSFTLTGYTFTGWNTESNGSGTGYTTGAELKNLTTTSGANVELYAQWEVNVHKLNFVVDGTTIQSGDVAYAAAILAPAEPKKDCNSFAGWTSSVEGLTTTGTMPDSDVTFTANWNYTCSRSSGGGGGGSSRNTEKTTETQTGSKVDSSTKATDTEDNTQDSSAEDTEGQNQGKTYSDEFQQAYEFAYKHGITTMPTIEQANMKGPLTRIAMAKMLSYYAINILGMKPDETRVNKFNDVSDKMDAEYNNAVSLAYQLGIMGINMPKNRFRPNDLVTRGEFATALSRMLYKIADGKDKYYSTHLAKLMEEKIITNNNPNLQELRGYVMIMLMRSAK